LNKELKQLLNEAERILYDNIDDEIKELENSIYPKIINPEKYKRLKKLYKSILTIDSDNNKAKQGIEICNTMLDEYFPVQYIAPIPNAIIDVDILEAPAASKQFMENSESLSTKTTQHQKIIKKEKLMPWIIRRDMLKSYRESDRAGMDYTSKVFSEETEKAELKADEIIVKVKTECKGNDGLIIFKEIKNKLEEYQTVLDRSWKGHGPDILYKLDDLVKELNIK